jgi:predicted amidohydrolase
VTDAAPAVAVAQTCPVAGDVEANLQEHLRLARRAAEQGAALVVFPELSLTGYELHLAPDLAFRPDDPRLAPLRDLAADRALTLVAGAPVRLGARLHIGAFVLRPDRTLGLYTKHRLGAFAPGANPGGTVPPPEASVFRPGWRNPLVRVGARTAALAVCADIGRPSHARRAAARGATLYLAGMFVLPADYAADSARLRGYAREHGMLVALANFGGPSGGLPAAGRSAIWSRAGRVRAELGARGSGVAVAAWR